MLTSHILSGNLIWLQFFWKTEKLFVLFQNKVCLQLKNKHFSGIEKLFVYCFADIYTIYLNASRGIITSRGYPKNYSSNTNSRWVISNPDKNVSSIALTNISLFTILQTWKDFCIANSFNLFQLTCLVFLSRKANLNFVYCVAAYHFKFEVHWPLLSIQEYLKPSIQENCRFMIKLIHRKICQNRLLKVDFVIGYIKSCFAEKQKCNCFNVGVRLGRHT